MIGTILRLAFAGIRTRRLAGFLTVILTGAAAATIVMTLEVGSTAADPWARTFEAANGAHVLANVTTEAEARSLARFSGVVSSNPPIPLVRSGMRFDGDEEQIHLQGLSEEPTVNRPVVVEGTNALNGGILVELSFAEALGIDVGSTVSFQTDGETIVVPVVGTAISPSQPRYPRRNPGLAWISRPLLEQIQPDQNEWRWVAAVRLDNPLTAPALAGQMAKTLPPGTFLFETWQDQRGSALQDADPIKIILGVYTLLLLVVSYSVIAILVGARVTGQRREIALLRAIGITPRQVSAVFALETTVAAVAGIVVGFVAGALLAPRLAAASAATMLGSPTVEANLAHILLAAVAVLPVIALSAYSAACRNTRAPVQESLRAITTVAGPNSVAARALAVFRVPLPIELGLKDLLGKRARGLWLMLAIIVTGAAMVVTMSAQAALSDRPAGEPSDVPAELPALIFTLDAVLAIVVVTALMGIALLTVRERIRDFGILRTIGLTPSQITVSLAGAHSIFAVVGSLVSIPVGVLLYSVLYRSASGESPSTVAPWWWLAFVPVVISAAAACATGVPARFATRIPAAESVRYE